MVRTDLPLEKIVLDYTLYPRTDISNEHVSRFREAICAGVELPPVVVCSKTYRLVDGFHRYSAYKKLKLKVIPAELREYATDAELYRDAVALNAAHGRPLCRYEYKRIVAKAEELGIKREEIAAILRIRPETLQELKKEVALTDKGPTPVKRGLEALQGQQISEKQSKLIRKWGGMNAVFYANQLIAYLEADVEVPAMLAERLDRLTELWRERKRQGENRCVLG